ncbi:hypothetical protein Hypma_004406 [Hypsizygus marmoreus]|uniref:Uncharacterized protein n=1 Tax=Hypsizygus marmoreus TaxID=39966 RepID=A0A369K155_HYPMA|nr:hypothetical protein Hypma_004406 [Hypsizygus marmoreus]
MFDHFPQNSLNLGPRSLGFKPHSTSARATMVLRIAGYLLSREDARRWAHTIGGFESSVEEGPWEGGILETWLEFSNMSKLFAEIRLHQWPRPTTLEGSPCKVFLERTWSDRDSKPLIENRYDIFVKEWFLAHGLRDIGVQDLEWAVIEDPRMEAMYEKYGAIPKSKEFDELVGSRIPMPCRLPNSGEIIPFDIEEFRKALKAKEADWGDVCKKCGGEM